MPTIAARARGSCPGSPLASLTALRRLRRPRLRLPSARASSARASSAPASPAAEPPRCLRAPNRRGAQGANPRSARVSCERPHEVRRPASSDAPDADRSRVQQPPPAAGGRRSDHLLASFAVSSRGEHNRNETPSRHSSGSSPPLPHPARSASTTTVRPRRAAARPTSSRSSPWAKQSPPRLRRSPAGRYAAQRRAGAERLALAADGNLPIPRQRGRSARRRRARLQPWHRPCPRPSHRDWAKEHAPPRTRRTARAVSPPLRPRAGSWRWARSRTRSAPPPDRSITVFALVVLGRSVAWPSGSCDRPCSATSRRPHRLPRRRRRLRQPRRDAAPPSS